MIGHQEVVSELLRGLHSHLRGDFLRVEDAEEAVEWFGGFLFGEGGRGTGAQQGGGEGDFEAWGGRSVFGLGEGTAQAVEAGLELTAADEPEGAEAQFFWGECVFFGRGPLFEGFGIGHAGLIPVEGESAQAFSVLGTGFARAEQLPEGVEGGGIALRFGQVSQTPQDGGVAGGEECCFPECFFGDQRGVLRQCGGFGDEPGRPPAVNGFHYLVTAPKPVTNSHDNDGEKDQNGVPCQSQFTPQPTPSLDVRTQLLPPPLDRFKQSNWFLGVPGGFRSWVRRRQFEASDGFVLQDGWVVTPWGDDRWLGHRFSGWRRRMVRWVHSLGEGIKYGAREHGPYC